MPTAPATALNPPENAVRAQFANGPVLDTVARQMLTAALVQHYPSLRIDLQRTRLAVPRPEGGWALEPFMPRVLDYLGRGAGLDLRPVNTQPCYLTDNPPDWLGPAEGELDMAIVEALAKELSWRLPIGLQGALNEFWAGNADTGASRWQWLSDVLKNTLRIGALQQTDLHPNALLAINQVITTPDSAQRIRLYGDTAVRAYWLKASLLGPHTLHSSLSSRIVLATREQVLLCKPDGSILTYKTLDSLSRAWARQISRTYTVREIRITHYELEGNVFDACAAAILNRQLEHIGALKLPASIGWPALQKVYNSITSTAQFLVDGPQASLYNLETINRHLPHWLRNASAADKARYRQYSLALTSAKKIAKGKTYLHGISDIRTYAADVLHQQMRSDQGHFEQTTPIAERQDHFDPEDIELTFLTATGLPDTVGAVETTTMSLTDLALKNLLGRPKGTLSLRHRRDLALPPWLTADYITQRGGLIETVNIGKMYPERLEDLLLGATADARPREQLFAAHLSVQLPLEALELSLKHEQGLTPLGARYVAAVVQTSTDEQQVEGTAVVMRHLALMRHPQASPDIASNMFLIEPANTGQGPHVLYRPFYTPSLLEFSTRTALLEAIAEPSPLQTSVLTWLSDIARPIYDNGGFREPHYVRFGLGSEFAPLERPTPAQLATNGSSDELLQYLHNGRLMEYLFGCNARALVAQADSDSVSNAESRWGVLMEGAGLIFNSLLLLPGLPPPLMLTGGLLSLASVASQDIPALTSSDAITRELAAADVLLNLGMLLLHQSLAAAQRPGPLPADLLAQALRPRAPVRIGEIWPEPEPPIVVTGLVALPGEMPAADSTVLDFSFASAHNRLTPTQRERLAGFKVAPPQPLPAPHPDGPHKGLYRIGQAWHARVGQDLYPVDIDSEGVAMIVSATDPGQRGPALKADSHGNWSLDLRLRLLGGMPPKRIAALQQHKAQRIRELQTQMTDFFPHEVPLQKAVEINHTALKRAMQDPRFNEQQIATFRNRLSVALHAELSAYQALLATVRERTELKIPFHETILISLLEKSFDNRTISLSISASEQKSQIAKWPQFTTPGPALEAAALQDPQGFMQSIREQVALNDSTIERIEQRDGYLEQLFNLGETGAATATELLQMLPAAGHTGLTLKGFQLDCLKLASSRLSAGTIIEESLDSAIDPLKEHAHTHNQLNTLEFDASKRLEILDSLVDNYGQALDALQGIGVIYADELEPEYFNKLRLLLTDLYQDVTRQLASEIRPTPQPTVKRPRKRTPSGAGSRPKKVINVRGKGKLIGELRPADSEWQNDVIEVRSDYDEQLLSTYLQHGDEWVEIKTVRPPSPLRVRALNIIKGDARKLFAMFADHLHKTRQYKNLSRHPQEVEELLAHEAQKLDRLATELHTALQAQAEAARLPDDQALVDNMRSAAQQMLREGREMRIQLSLELPPTHGNLQYLIDQELVQMAGLGNRIQLAGERRDFIQEYAVNDRQGRPLWYAHFHYPEATTPKQDYSVAHLKTKAQRKLSYWSQLADAKSGQAVVIVHRGQIGRVLAERWFLPLAN